MTTTIAGVEKFFVDNIFMVSIKTAKSTKFWGHENISLYGNSLMYSAFALHERTCV